ncbi:uncharacterized protein N7479_001105 [Penicillium vulpinum]|uniref:uncharacterized protein n=1 Tax=Penicillium vulpinum TaxID=29845 RepID=UPI002546A19F|nr:uncharacterized protein N7479_001105 [Penicillium vulpinum]KAJ5971187.1 hypothetical protein N7479_001105 [Penicillium vulpinum]
MVDDTIHLSSRVSRSCDQCKARKLHYLVQFASPIYENCLKRGTICHFGYTKRRLKQTSGAKSPNRGM